VIETVTNVDELDGILYSDIKHLLNDKTILENILFTTKVIFVNNEEIVAFMNKLMQYGYEDIALDYVEEVYDKVVIDFSNLKTLNANKIK
jgi:hypothetical protein